MSALVLQQSSTVASPARRVPSSRPAATPSRPTLRLVAEPARREAVPVRATRAPLRLTRRGRVVVRVAVVLLGLLAAAAVVLAGGQRAFADPQGAPMRVEYRVVQPGESLWQIAGEVAPGVDRRDTVARIAELNDLRTGVVAVGTRIAVPVS